ncbi:putative phospholipid hydroperoxide glutathione peroxidase 6, mitochondrial [Vitis vinifera]|uniref:Glutathione peroxidase n=1 Tax=Vitis vinifera TaxID=29760 RepID=A0A438BZT7_VITVI|nr:putative phospholipid hydroperoxide glutathione peroxidase 6, mitochondrial [Vitis vinifera]
MASQSSPQSVHSFTVKDARGNDVDLSIYKGKALLIVNVASQCGLTNSNYTELHQLYEKYKDQGLEILAFPCNQFGAQEPGSNEEIEKFVCTRFKAEYPIFDKIDVNGDSAAPLYKFLKSSKGGLFGDNIKWNFSKFLVDKDGKVVDRYAPTTTPLSIEVKAILPCSWPDLGEFKSEMIMLPPTPSLPLRFLSVKTAPWSCRVEIQIEFPQTTATAAEYSIRGLKSIHLPESQNITQCRSKYSRAQNQSMTSPLSGLTNSNYTELNQLYEKYKDQGLEILAFPCNQFGEEEPGSNEQILEFVCTRFQSEFPVFDKPFYFCSHFESDLPDLQVSSSKPREQPQLLPSGANGDNSLSIDVNGENAAPLYKFLKSGKWGIFGDDIQWNFGKFLVDKNGKIVDRYYPTTSPLTVESFGFVKPWQNDVKKLLEVS